jgi:hypothetical protein
VRSMLGGFGWEGKIGCGRWFVWVWGLCGGGCSLMSVGGAGAVGWFAGAFRASS